jgi:hypothetical protein
MTGAVRMIAPSVPDPEYVYHSSRILNFSSRIQGQTETGSRIRSHESTMYLGIFHSRA